MRVIYLMLKVAISTMTSGRDEYLIAATVGGRSGLDIWFQCSGLRHMK